MEWVTGENVEEEGENLQGCRRCKMFAVAGGGQETRGGEMERGAGENGCLGGGVEGDLKEKAGGERQERFAGNREKCALLEEEKVD